MLVRWGMDQIRDYAGLAQPACGEHTDMPAGSAASQ